MRTLKIAVSLDRMGLDSQIYEGQRGRPLPPECPVTQLVEPIVETQTPDTTSSASLPRRLWRLAVSLEASWPLSALAFLVYLGAYCWRFFAKPIFLLPPATLYYLHEYSFFPAVWIKSRLHGAAIVYDAHDFYRGIEPVQRQSRFHKWRNAFGILIENACIRRSDIFVTVSDGVADLYNRVSERRPLVIKNCHDERLESKIAHSLHTSIGLAEDIPLAVVVGQAKAGQDFTALLCALENLPECHLALVGNGYRTRISEYQTANNLKDRIHYIENVQANEVVPTIVDANVSVIIYYPLSDNYLYALPNGFFQSVAAKLPILYGPLPEVENICHSLDIGMNVSPSNATEMTMALSKIIRDADWVADQRNKTAEAARNLSWQNEEEKLIRALEYLVKPSGKPKAIM